MKKTEKEENSRSCNGVYRVTARDTLTEPWPYLSIDDVVWSPEHGRWLGRNSPLLTKRERLAAAAARRRAPSRKD